MKNQDKLEKFNQEIGIEDFIRKTRKRFHISTSVFLVEDSNVVFMKFKSRGIELIQVKVNLNNKRTLEFQALANSGKAYQLFAIQEIIKYLVTIAK